MKGSFSPSVKERQLQTYGLRQTIIPKQQDKSSSSSDEDAKAKVFSAASMYNSRSIALTSNLHSVRLPSDKIRQTKLPVNYLAREEFISSDMYNSKAAKLEQSSKRVEK